MHKHPDEMLPYCLLPEKVIKGVAIVTLFYISCNMPITFIDQRTSKDIQHINPLDSYGHIYSVYGS